MENDIEQLKYPIGEFVGQDDYNLAQVETFVDTIRLFPSRLKEAVQQLSDHSLATPYRKDGWTIRQVVHHLADSHMNALMRFKLCLTEDNPTIKPYNEASFAELPDYGLPLTTSLNMIEGIHQHWVYLLANMAMEDFKRTYFHPEHQKSFDLHLALANYDWHCKHHLAHIELAKKAFHSK